MPSSHEAFIVSPKADQRVRRLNEAVLDCEILPIVGERGAGKDRFLEWWWQLGCVQDELPSGAKVQPQDIVLVNALPSPASGIPVAALVFTKIWRALEEIERARVNGERPRPLGKPRPCTESQIVSVIYDNVHLLADDLQPLAFVICGAQHLDKRTLNFLLELRTPVRYNQPRTALRSLILCASIEDDVESSKFSKLLNSVDETRAVWPNKLEIKAMDAEEFSVVMLKLISQNLNAVFGDDVEPLTALKQFGEWTDANWWMIVELVKVLDRGLGPTIGDKPRVLSQKVLEYVQQKWLRRTPTHAVPA